MRVCDGLYVRSANGRNAVWYRHAQASHEGRIRSGGVDRDVTLIEADDSPELTRAIQAEYHRKYDHYGENITKGALSLAAQDATFRLVPR